jgi:hypothetical protein
MSETVVYTRNGRYEPETLVKHAWGVVMFIDGCKRSYPWHMVEQVDEPVPEREETEYSAKGSHARIY